MLVFNYTALFVTLVLRNKYYFTYLFLLYGLVI